MPSDGQLHDKCTGHGVLKEDGGRAAEVMIAPALVGATAGAASATGLIAVVGNAVGEGHLQVGLQAQAMLNSSEVAAIVVGQQAVKAGNAMKSYVLTHRASAYIGANLNEWGDFVEGLLGSLLNVEGPPKSVDAMMGDQTGKSIKEVLEDE